MIILESKTQFEVINCRVESEILEYMSKLY